MPNTIWCPSRRLARQRFLDWLPRLTARPETVVWAVARDRAVGQRDGKGREQPAAMNCEAGAGRQRVVRYLRVDEGQTWAWRSGEEQVVPDPATEGFSAGCRRRARSRHRVRSLTRSGWWL